MFTTEQGYDESVHTCVRDAGFQRIRIARTLGIPDHLFALVADEFDEDEGADAPVKYQASCPYYTIRTECGIFGIAFVGPEFPVLDLKGIDKPLGALGKAIADHVYPCEDYVIRALKLLLS